jgi:hypothetical protein
LLSLPVLHLILNFYYFRLAEKDPLLLMGIDNSSPVIALSISSSMLAAAAAAVANDVGELIEVATFLAVVTCRQAVQIRLRGIQMEDGSGDWAFSALGEIVTHLPLILDNFHRDHVRQCFPSFMTFQQNEENPADPSRQSHSIEKHISAFKHLLGRLSLVRHRYWKSLLPALPL